LRGGHLRDGLGAASHVVLPMKGRMA
jgi:hypothetical protein